MIVGVDFAVVFDGVRGNLDIRGQVPARAESAEQAERDVEVAGPRRQKHYVGSGKPRSSPVDRRLDGKRVREHTPVRGDAQEAEQTSGSNPDRPAPVQRVFPETPGSLVQRVSIDLCVEQQIDIGYDHRPERILATTASSSSSSTSLLNEPTSIPGRNVVTCG